MCIRDRSRSRSEGFAFRAARRTGVVDVAVALVISWAEQSDGDGGVQSVRTSVLRDDVHSQVFVPGPLRSMVSLLNRRWDKPSTRTVAEHGAVVLGHDSPPVSYTHLDVYKRQSVRRFTSLVARRSRPARRLSFDRPTRSWRRTLCGSRPVSYTHLDVYKRQVPAPVRCGPHRGRRSGVPGELRTT